MVRLFTVRSSASATSTTAVWAHNPAQAAEVAAETGFMAPLVTPTRRVRGWNDDLQEESWGASRAAEHWFSTGTDPEARCTPLMELRGTKRVA